MGVSWDKERSFNAKHGMEMETVEEWAKKNVIVSQV
jgi:hypothetical protein